MKKIILFLLLLFASTLMISCESDSDSQNASDKIEKSIVISGKSHDVIDGSASDIYQYSGEGWRVIVTDKTKIYYQRESCSGLNKSNPSDIRIGDTIYFKYNPYETDYIGPNVARAYIIEGYKPDCLDSSGSLLIVTNTITSTSTVTTTTITTNIIRR